MFLSSSYCGRSGLPLATEIVLQYHLNYAQARPKRVGLLSSWPAPRVGLAADTRFG